MYYVLCIVSLPTAGKQPNYGGSLAFNHLSNFSLPLKQDVNKVLIHDQGNKPEHGQQTKLNQAIATSKEQKTCKQQTKDRRMQAQNK